MNSVNWAGNTSSSDVSFRLTWQMPNGNPKSALIGIPISDANVRTAIEVANKLVGVWNSQNRAGPYAVGIGTGVHFVTNVQKVELSGNAGSNWKEVPQNGKAIPVPGDGNDGLCVWLSP